MQQKWNKRISVFGLACLTAAVLVGCAAGKQQESTSAAQSAAMGSAEIPAASASVLPEATPSATRSASAASATPARTFSPSGEGETLQSFLDNMKELAAQGRVMNSEFPVDTTTIDDVIAMWGEPDSSEYIADAKGTYATYGKLNVVYGFNKGDQIFEVRSSDGQLKNITLSAIEAAYGKPDYENTITGQKIIGYVITDKYKMLLVFDTSKGTDDPYMDHYSIFYPAGTVNSMAGDPGREW